MTAVFNTLFLRDVNHGGDPGQAGRVASAVAAFAAAATTSLDLAIYDLRLDDPTLAGTVVDALTGAAGRGVTVRVAYDAGKPAGAAQAAFTALQADPAPTGTADWIHQHLAGTGVQVQAIHAAPQLMHDKYLIRDAPTGTAGAAADTAPTAAVWTGSTNFTDDAWTRQENNILTVTDPDLARGYRTDFDQMWATGTITDTGAGAGGTTTTGGATLGWNFSPADGPAIDTTLAARVTAAAHRIQIAAMVLTSHQLLAALAGALTRGIPVTGIYDGGQMDPIERQWRANPHDSQILADWETVRSHLAVKHSTPYTPTGPHDFMHLKVLLVDTTVTTGSYNFSTNAEHNAENQITLDDPDTATAYRTYLDTITAAYTTP